MKDPFKPTSQDLLAQLTGTKVRTVIASQTSGVDDQHRRIELVSDLTMTASQTRARYVVTVGDKEWTYSFLDDACRRYCGEMR